MPFSNSEEKGRRIPLEGGVMVKDRPKTHEKEFSINGYEEGICKFSKICGGVRNREYFNEHCINGGKDCDKYERNERRFQRR